MSRAHNARRKALRRLGPESKPPTPRRLARLRRPGAVLPVLLIAVIFGIVGVSRFGGGGEERMGMTPERVTALLSGIPQHGSVLGSPDAPLTLWVLADLECPTVRQFADVYLPRIVETWVRREVVKIQYLSLRTDTNDEGVFFKQETAALAAGRQNKMWNYVLTFIGARDEPHTEDATLQYMRQIASQVPGLDRARWLSAWADPLLSKEVATEGHQANLKQLRYTPSFLLGFSDNTSDRTLLGPVKDGIESSLRATASALAEESSVDTPAYGFGGFSRSDLTN